MEMGRGRCSALRGFGKQQPVMATVREKGEQTWREACLQLQRAAGGGGKEEGGIPRLCAQPAPLQWGPGAG